MNARRNARALAILGFAFFIAVPLSVHAQTVSQDQLRATIKAEIMADPRSQNLSQAQIQALVNSLATQAQKQGVSVSQLVYRPTPATPESQTAPVPAPCSNFFCALSHAYGLDGSAPWIVGGLFITTVLAIFFFSRLREMGHPHAQFPGDTPAAPVA